MREHSVITIRVMLDTDQEEKAWGMSDEIEERIRSLTDLRSRPFVLDTEVTGHEFLPYGSFRKTAASKENGND